MDAGIAPAGNPPLRVLIASHSHPEISNGGAEIAAFQLFRGLQERSDCSAWFLGCDRSPASARTGAVLRQPYSAAEHVYVSTDFDWFKFANPDPRFRQEIERLFERLAPDIVHFHHYINFGVEVFQHLKRVRPDCAIVLTLHEYLAICNHFGQMVTKPHNSLCYQSSPARCQLCFPEFSRSDFFLRQLYIKRYLRLVDRFVAPSQHLAERYIAWGLPAAKMHVMENVMPQADPAEAAQIPLRGPLRIGFFGQISALKGIDVMFEAAASLLGDAEADVSFEIHGDYRAQPPEFQAAFLRSLAKAGANIRFYGPYDRERVNTLMRSVHAVLVPSVWWENSPVVIQEALRNRRPVICSDIGGMAEKVRNGVDGWHFPVSNALALADLLRDLATDRPRMSALAAAMSGHAAVEASVQDVFDLYKGVTGALAPRPARAFGSAR
jgi:glycosyltransferase involved in cell wall biosynthesis